MEGLAVKRDYALLLYDLEFRFNIFLSPSLFPYRGNISASHNSRWSICVIGHHGYSWKGMPDFISTVNFKFRFWRNSSIFTRKCAHDMKNNCCVIERFFRIRKNGIFLVGFFFWVPFCIVRDEHFWCQVWRTLLQYFKRYFFIHYFTI